MVHLVMVVIALCTMLPSRTVAQVSDSLELRPGDLVQINVWRKPEYSGEFRVAADGVLADPFYQDIRVVGMPFSAAAERLRGYIARFEASPRVWVEPLVRINVSGAGGKSGIVSVPKGTTVAEVLAGADRNRAQMDRVEFVRGGEIRQLDLSSPTATAGSIAVRSGDQIYVPERRPSLLQRIVPYTTAITVVGTALNLFFQLK